jgi:hypothetical protein
MTLQDDGTNVSYSAKSPMLFVIAGLLLLFTTVAEVKYLALFSLLSSFGFSSVGLLLATSLPQRIIGVTLSGLSGGLCAIVIVIYVFS